MTPKAKDHDLYLDSLAKKVAEMIRITNGKSLVLFTSKTDMKEVYQRLQEQEFPFDLLIQEEGKNAEVIKEKFKNDSRYNFELKDIKEKKNTISLAYLMFYSI